MPECLRCTKANGTSPGDRKGMAGRRQNTSLSLSLSLSLFREVRCININFRLKCMTGKRLLLILCRDCSFSPLSAALVDLSLSLRVRRSDRMLGPSVPSFSLSLSLSLSCCYSCSACSKRIELRGVGLLKGECEDRAQADNGRGCP